jgi:hypothetical protein
MKKLLLTGIAVLMLIAPVHAQPPDILIKPTWKAGPPEPYREKPERTAKEIEALRTLKLLPPEEFDHEHTGVIMVVIRTTQTGVRAACPNKFKSEAVALGWPTRRQYLHRVHRQQRGAASGRI